MDLETVRALLAAVGRVAVVEEGTVGGGWADHVAALIQEQLWGDLVQPVVRLGSADSIIPSARHLEDRVLLDADVIAAALTVRIDCGATRSPDTDRLPAADTADAAASAVPGPVPLTVPKLNNNDETYLVVTWLVEEGQWVATECPVVEVESSKAVEEITAPATGHLRQLAREGEERPVGDVLGYLAAELDQALPSAPSEEPQPQSILAPPSPSADILGPLTASPSTVHRLDRAQQGTAAVVTRSHQEIPAAFTVVRVEVDHVLDGLGRYGERTGTEAGLPDVLVKAIALAYAEFGVCFGTLADDHSVSLPNEPLVGVTLAPDETLYVPVVRGAATLTLDEVSDVLMDLRMKAARHEFTARELDGANISLSLNPEPGVVLVQPLILWPQVCMVSGGAVAPELRPVADGSTRICQVIHLGLAYDHRVVNGQTATALLTRLRTSLEDPTELLDE